MKNQRLRPLPQSGQVSAGAAQAARNASGAVKASRMASPNKYRQSLKGCLQKLQVLLGRCLEVCPSDVALISSRQIHTNLHKFTHLLRSKRVKAAPFSMVCGLYEDLTYLRGPCAGIGCMTTGTDSGDPRQDSNGPRNSREDRQKSGVSEYVVESFAALAVLPGVPSRGFMYGAVASFNNGPRRTRMNETSLASDRAFATA